VIGLLALALLAGGSDSLRFRPEDIDSLPLAITRVDTRASRLTIELPAIEVPAGHTTRTPVYRVAIPFAVSLYGFAVELVDERGVALPPDRLHHIVFTDPNRRELFLPLALPIFAASKESPRPVLPRYRIGMPLPRSQRYLIAAMFANPDDRPRSVSVRLVLSFVRPGRIVPQVYAYAWTLDVTYPFGREGGRHDFDLPPGRSVFSWEASPQTSGTIIAMGGHAHDFATAIQFEDVTASRVLWRQVPLRDGDGHVLSISPTRFTRWYRRGVRVQPSHVYRVTVWYDNPTGQRIPHGGMGSVAGLVVPDRSERWPRLDAHDPIYQVQINNLLSNMTGIEMSDAHHH
jgi:hypothetical protein